MVKVKNLGNKTFLRTGQWFEAGETIEMWVGEANFLKLIHKIEIITEKKKKTK